MRRGEIWWAELPAPAGNRPVVILPRDSVLASIGSVVVALVTTSVREVVDEKILLPVPQLLDRRAEITGGSCSLRCSESVSG